MPSVVVDSVLVEAGWDPSALERGLALSERLVLEFAKIHPSVTVGVDGREIDGLNARIKTIGKTPIVLPPIVVPPLPPIVPPAANIPPIVLPPVVVPPPDFSATIAESIRAATIVREEFEAALRSASTVMGVDAFKAGIIAGKELQAGLIGQIQGIGKQVAAGLISIPQATAQIDAAITAMSLEAKRLQGTIPPIQIRTVVMPEGARGVTTGTSPSIIPTAELDEAERKFDELSGAAEVTNQTFVRVGSSSSAMRMGVRQAASSLTVLATQAIGTNSAVGRLAESVVLLGTGFAGTEGKIGAVLGKIGIAAGVVLGLAKAYEFLNTARAEAQKIQDDLVAGLLQEASAMSAAEKAARGLAAALQAKAEAESLGRRTSDFLKGAALGAVGLPGAGAELDRRRQQDLANATKAATQAQRDQVQAFRDTHAAEVAALTEGITLRIATTKEIQRGADFLPILKRLSEDTNLPLKERIAFLKELTGLEAARAAIPSAAPGDAAIVALGRQVAVLQIGEAAVKKLEAAQAALFAGQRTGIGVLDDVRARLQRQKDAHDEAAKAAAQQGAELRDNLADAIQVVTDALNKLGDADPFTKLLAKQRKAFKAPDLGDVSLSSTGISGGFDRAAAAADDIGKALTKAAAASNKFFAKAKKDAEDTRTAIQKFNDSIHEITRGADGILGAAVNVGLIGDEAANSIGSVLSLADALGNLAESASTGNILGAIGAGIGLLGGAFGKSPGQIESDRIMAENNQRLAELRSALDRSIQGVGGQVKIGVAARGLATSGADVIGRELTIPGVGTIEKGMAFLEQEARKFGVTFAQLQAIAKENGITLLDSKGRIVVGAFDALANATGATIAAMTKFGTSFAEEVSFAELTARITGGVGDAVDAFQRDLVAAGAPGVGSTFIADFFKGIDIRGDADAFQKRLQELLALFAPDSTFFKENPGLLGGLTVEDWKKLLGDGASAMELLTDATTKAQKSLGDLNIPQGFRRAAIAFQTGDIGPDLAQLTARTAAVTALFPTGAPVIQPLPADMQALLDRIASKAPPDLLTAVQEITATIQAGRQTATAGDVNTAAPAAIFGGPKETRTTVTFEGGINVYISGEHADPNKMADDFFAALRRKALTQSGDTLQFGVR